MTAKLRIDDGIAWIGDRRMPEGTRVFSHDHELEHPDTGKRFVTHARIFKLPFENGWTVTVDWGRQFAGSDEAFVEQPEAASVEVADRHGRVALWDEAGIAVGRSLDHVGKRHDVPAKEILRIIDEVATWPSEYLPILDRV